MGSPGVWGTRRARGPDLIIEHLAVSPPPAPNVRAWPFPIAPNLYRNHFRAEGRRRQAMVMAAAGASERGSSWPEGEAIASPASARIDPIGPARPAQQRP